MKKINGINEPLDPNWLKSPNGLPVEAVAFAEKLGIVLVDMQNGKPSNNQMSTSQVRNFFGEMRRIQMKGFENNKGAFNMLKPKLAYAVARAGKSSKIKIFQEATNYLMDAVTDQPSYDNFMSFMEAVVAYHKANGGKD